MAQGKIKIKKSTTKFPSGAKAKNKQRKALGPKKGGRPIAPKKSRAIESQKLKKDFDKSMKALIEEDCTKRAANSDPKSLVILKSVSDKTDKKGTTKGDGNT